MSDDTVQPRDGVFYASSEPLQPADGTVLEPAVQGVPAQYMPAQYIPATPALPAETVQGTPLQPLQPAQFMPAQYDAATPAIPAEPAVIPRDGTLLESGERVEAPLADDAVQPRDGVVTSSPLQPFQRAEAVPLGQEEPRAYESTGPQATPRAYESTGPQATPRAYESTGPGAKPAMLDREAAAEPSGDNDNNGDNGDNDPPPSTDNPPPSTDNPPPSSDTPPPASTSGGPQISVDTDKLAPLSPTLNGVMRQLDSLGNNTANGINSYDLVKDSYGEAYDKVATPIASQILDGIFNASTVFGQTADGADLTVHNYQMTEENATESANDLLTRSED
jgi:hypothetical protein